MANLLVFRSTASGLLRLVPEEEDDDIDFMLEKVARFIVCESKQLVPEKNTYRVDRHVDIALECVSQTLLTLLLKLSKKLNQAASAIWAIL